MRRSGHERSCRPAPFDDTPRLAKSAATEEEALAHYRRVRDEIRQFVETLPESLDKKG